MNTVTIELPIMYGDHQVIEVRRILLAISGIESVFASSAFRQVEVAFDPGKVDEVAIRARLGEAGYLEEWILPGETGEAAYHAVNEGPTYFRHTAVFETSRKIVSFSQQIPDRGQPLWPCPGFGALKVEE